ncbi:MAG: Holliday junction branch migration protein RuvA [Methylovirgula sp.]
MIGKLSGRLDSVGEDFIILDVHGVGYVVHCSPRTLSELPRSGDVALAVETQVREDSIRLYGFLRDTERDWFRLLQTVQGVGAKLALAILGTFEPAELGVLIARQDKVAIARAPGVGPRLAARLISELKEKAAACGAGAASVANNDVPAAEDAIAALINLGYSRPQAAGAVANSRAALGDDAEASELIRRGLRELAR